MPCLKQDPMKHRKAPKKIQRCGKAVDVAFPRITKKMDRIQHVVNKLLLLEYNEAIITSDFAMRIGNNRKKHGKKKRS